MRRKRILMMVVALSVFLLAACEKKDNVEPSETAEQVTTIAETEAESVKETEPVETEAVTEAYENDFSIYTDKDEREIEAFVDEINVCFAKEDWEALSQIMYFPIIINETYYSNAEEFMKTDWSSVFSVEFIETMANAELANAWVSWRGIGLESVMIVENTNHQLTVGELNYSDGKEHKGDTSLYGPYAMNQVMTEERLEEYDSLFEMFGTAITVGTMMTLEKDENGNIVYQYHIGTAGYSQGIAFVDESSITLIDSAGENVLGYENIDGEMYIEMPYNGETLYWKKLALP